MTAMRHICSSFLHVSALTSFTLQIQTCYYVLSALFLSQCYSQHLTSCCSRNFFLDTKKLYSNYHRWLILKDFKLKRMPWRNIRHEMRTIKSLLLQIMTRAWKHYRTTAIQFLFKRDLYDAGRKVLATSTTYTQQLRAYIWTYYC